MEENSIRDGRVVGFMPGKILVRIDKEEECETCHSCAIKGLCRGREESYMDVPVTVGDGQYAEGDPVRIRYRAANPAVAALVMFLPSLFGLVFGGLAAVHLWPGSDSLLLAGCLVGISAGVAVTYAAAKSLPSLRPDVRLLEK